VEAGLPTILPTSAIPFTGTISSIGCETREWEASVTTEAYSLPGSDGAYSFDSMTLSATLNSDTNAWSGSGSGDGEIGGLKSLSKSFSAMSFRLEL
jgi:hypothetical protein